MPASIQRGRRFVSLADPGRERGDVVGVRSPTVPQLSGGLSPTLLCSGRDHDYDHVFVLGAEYWDRGRDATAELVAVFTQMWSAEALRSEVGPASNVVVVLRYDEPVDQHGRGSPLGIAEHELGIDATVLAAQTVSEARWHSPRPVDERAAPDADDAPPVRFVRPPYYEPPRQS